MVKVSVQGNPWRAVSISVFLNECFDLGQKFWLYPIDNVRFRPAPVVVEVCPKHYGPSGPIVIGISLCWMNDMQPPD